MTKLLVPVFLPFIVWCIGGLFLENLTTTEHEVNGTGPSNSSQAYLWGLGIAIVLAGVLQLTLGRAGLWWLSDKKREWKWVLLGCLAGAVLAVLFS